MSKQYLGRDFGSADGAESDKIKPGMLNTLAEVLLYYIGTISTVAYDPECSTPSQRYWCIISNSVWPGMLNALAEVLLYYIE